MKRKRGVGRRKPNRVNVADADNRKENIVSSAAKGHSGWNDVAKDAIDVEVETTQANATNSRGPTAGMNNAGSINKAHGGNSCRENNVFKNVASFAAKLSRAVGSPTSDPCIYARPIQDEVANAGELRFPKGPLDNKEFNAALSVIKTIMKMDAAKPFNTPVDPEALGIPDYFDIIDTPMDFSTICQNIDLGFKYKDSKDIYRDVELIWDNCSKYYKKGTHVLELMKHVKTKLLKLWSAAGLHVQRQEPSNVDLEKDRLHAAESSMWHNHYGHSHLDGPMIGNSIHQGNPCRMSEELRQPNSSCCSYECRPRHISSQCPCSWCLRDSESSMPHNFVGVSSGGATSQKNYSQPHFDIMPRQELSHQPPSNCGFQFQSLEKSCQHQPCSNRHQAILQKAGMNTQNLGSLEAYSSPQKQYQTCYSHVDNCQPALIYTDDLSHHLNLSHFVGNEPMVPSTCSGGHPHLNLPMEIMERLTTCRQGNSIGPVHDVPGLQKHHRADSTQVPSFSRMYSLSHQPQEKNWKGQLDSCSHKVSIAHDVENVGSAGHFRATPPGESSVRHGTCRRESSTAPGRNNYHFEDHQIDQNESESPLSEEGGRHVPEEDGHGSQPSRHESSTAPARNNGHSEDYQVGQNESESPLSEGGVHVPEEDGHGSQPTPSPADASFPGDEHTNHKGDSTPLKRKTRVRGPTRCRNLWFPGEKISITTNELGQPVCANTSKLISFLGTLARDGHKAPLNYHDWRAMPEVYKENMLKLVEDKFVVDARCKYWIMKSLSKKWKDWKARLKSELFLPHATNEEMLAVHDDRVLPDQWTYLVSHWKTESALKRSAINKACRAKLVLGHAVGTKSFARLREEQRLREPDKKAPSRAELFMLTRMRKNGTPLNEATSAIIDQLRQNKDTSQTIAAQDEAFSQLVGRRKNGHVRCSELDALPSEIRSTKPTREVTPQVAPEANAEVFEIKQRLVAMEETCAQMASQMATMMSMMSSLQKNFSNGNVPELANNGSGTSEELLQQQVSSGPVTRSSRRRNI